jgi:hypothetical protein
VKNSQIKCLNCPAGENEYNDVDENENGDNEVNITGKVPKMIV